MILGGTWAKGGSCGRGKSAAGMRRIQEHRLVMLKEEYEMEVVLLLAVLLLTKGGRGVHEL